MTVMVVAVPSLSDSLQKGYCCYCYSAPDAAVTDTRRLVVKIHGKQIDKFSYKPAGQRINAGKKRSWPRIVVGATRNLTVCCAVHRASTCCRSIAC
jgi:hypothetical protein